MMRKKMTMTKMSKISTKWTTKRTTTRTLAGILGLISLAACASKQPAAPQTAAGAAAPAPGGTVLTPSAPAPKLLDAASVRGLALATVSLTSLDRFLTNGATLIAPAVPLPIDPSSVRDMLISQSGLPPEVAANLDFGAPAGAVVVPVPEGTGIVVAIAARGPTQAARALEALGKRVEVRGEFVLVEGGAGARLWLLRDGALLVFSSSLDALARGARLAEEARHAVAEDVTAVLYPDAIAKANGTDVKSAIAFAVEQLKAAQAAQGGAHVNEHAYDSAAQMLALVGDASTIELGLVADPTRGLSLRVRLMARTASNLEKIAREAKPYELDTSLLPLVKAPTLVASWTIGSFMRAQMMAQRDLLQTSKAKGATAALAYTDAFISALAGSSTIVVGVGKTSPPFSGVLGYPLKDATAAAAVRGAMDRLDRDAAVAAVEVMTGKLPFLDWAFKKESVGKLKALRYTVTFKNTFGVDPKFFKRLLGKPIEIYEAVAGTRVLMTFGKDAKANLAKAAAAPPSTPTGALAETLAATKGRDGFVHLDVAPIISVATDFAKDKDKRAEVVARANTLPIPIYESGGGDGVVGRVLAFELTFPPAAFKGAGGLVKAAMTAGAAPPEEAPKGKKKGGGKKK